MAVAASPSMLQRYPAVANAGSRAAAQGTWGAEARGGAGDPRNSCATRRLSSARGSVAALPRQKSAAAGDDHCAAAAKGRINGGGGAEPASPAPNAIATRGLPNRWGLGAVASDEARYLRFSDGRVWRGTADSVFPTAIRISTWAKSNNKKSRLRGVAQASAGSPASAAASATDTQSAGVGGKEESSASSSDLLPQASAAADVVIVGGGLAGLCCALHLYTRGVDVVVLEASDDVGGRVRTDQLDGFLLDRGFQIFLTAYPEAQAVLEYDKLRLRPFYAGALVRFGGGFHRLADPFRHPLDALRMLAPDHPVGSLADKLRVVLLRLRCASKSDETILLSRTETTSADFFFNQGFSFDITDRFFKPFLGGIFFDRHLSTSSRLLEFILKILVLGDNALPAAGFGSIPNQIADRLPRGAIRLTARALQIREVQSCSDPSVVPGAIRKQIANLKDQQDDHGTPGQRDQGGGGGRTLGVKEVELEGGVVVRARKGVVVVATEAPEARRLLGDSLDVTSSAGLKPRGTVCLYFALDHPPPPPGDEPVVFLNGTSKGLINNMCFVSSVAPEYAPSGKELVSVSLVGTYPDRTDVDLETEVRAELGDWFGVSEVATWRHLRTYRIPYAQPDQRPPWEAQRAVRLGDGLYVCGDHRNSASFHGAMVSGRQAAEAILHDLQIA